MQGGQLRLLSHQGGKEGLVAGPGQAGEAHLGEIGVASPVFRGMEDRISLTERIFRAKSGFQIALALWGEI